MGTCAGGLGLLAMNSVEAVGESTNAPTVSKPNILFVLSDNQSWCHCSVMGDPVVRTPAMDRVARQGILFHQGYAPCPSCTPSRAATLTGQDIWRLEEAGLLWGGFPAKFPVYTDLLRDAGYHVGYTGKGWGPGNWRSHGRTTDPAGEGYNRLRGDDAPPGISRRDYAANFEAFLKDREDGQPFCFWFGAQEPHRPFPEGIGLQEGKKPAAVPVPAFLPDCPVIRNDFLDYYSEIEWFDRHLGRMLDHLEALGELGNTLVVVTSDNGIQMPRGITTLYDHGVHVPLALCWGDRVRANQTSNAFVNLIDLAPTFLDAAGVPVPEQMTGRSLLPLITEGTGEQEREYVVTAIERHTVCRPDNLGYPSRAIRTHEYLYIRNYEPERWPAGAPDFKAAAQGYYGDIDRSPTKAWMMEHAEDPDVRDSFALCFGKRPAEELYYLPDDPDQVNNVAQAPAHEVARKKLAARLEAYLKQTADPRMQGKSPWDQYPYNAIENFGR